jgi:IMP dehydrogenase
VQAEQVRQVKKFESGMVVNPLTIGPDATLADALELMKETTSPAFRSSEARRAAAPVKLVGILTNRDVRFATRPASRSRS